MNIGIDIDDTITKTFEEIFPSAIEFVEKFLKRRIELDYSKTFDHKYIEKIFKLSDEEADLFWKLNLEKIYNTIEPKERSIEIINQLKEEGHNIIIITARWNSDYLDADKLTQKWLKKYNLKYDKLFTNLESKKQTAVNEKIDIFIDDSIRNCREVSEAGIKCWLFESEVNKKNEESKNFDSVSSWSEVYEKINKEGI